MRATLRRVDVSLGGPLSTRALGVARALDLAGSEVSIAEADVRTDRSPSALPTEIVGTVEFSFDGDHGHQTRVFRVADDERIVLDWWGGPDLNVCTFAATTARAEELLRGILDYCGEIAAPADKVGVTFWSWSDRWGAQSRWRGLDAGTWSDVAANYPSAARADLERIMRWSSGPDTGQLLLLYGPPGTGKTHAIRALAQEWRDWCDVAYIVDPDRFFGSADYMLDVLLHSDDEDRWMLVVVEDTDELITTDAKAKSGQSMSRLLNVCDGFVGQGLQVMVLLTTNEPIEGLAPAVKRAGRCAAQVEVGAFPPDEATAWLHARGFTDGDSPERTLADLYAHAAHLAELDAIAARVGR